jgi:hypothetical protein
MKSIKTAFVCYKKINDKACGQSNGKACNVDEGIERILMDIPQGDRQIVFNHIREDIVK